MADGDGGNALVRPDDQRVAAPSSTGPVGLVILNQMAGPMTWELAVDLIPHVGQVTLFTGHPDSLAKSPPPGLTCVPSVAYRRGGLLTRFWSWIRYSLHIWYWLWRLPRSTPVLVFSNPPIAGWFVRWHGRWRGLPYAVMVHDIFPDVLVRKGILAPRHVVVRWWRSLNRAAYGSARLVMTLGPHMRATLADQYRDPQLASETIQVVPPWSDDRQLRPLAKSGNWFAKHYGQVDKLTIMYSGNMGLGHDLDSLLGAAERLGDTPTAHFMLIGAGPKWDELAARQLRHPLPNVTLLGWQPEADLPFSLATADVAIVSLEREMSGLAVPSKAYYFLAAHVPLIAVCDPQSELAELVRQYACGIVVPPGQPEQIAAILRRLVAEPELLAGWRAGAAAAMESHRRPLITDQFARLLAQHVGTPYRFQEPHAWQSC